MGERLKGFRDYTDYLTYAEIYLFWMNSDEHRQTYDMLLKRQLDINPISYIRKVSLEAHNLI